MARTSLGIIKKHAKIFILFLYCYNVTYKVFDVAKTKNVLNFKRTYQLTT
jgi:hypothetical protein